MSETIYSIEHAKTGRSSCKKCKSKIGKGDLRIQSNSTTSNDMHFTQNYHVACFAVPKKLKTSVEDFVNDILEDHSGEILPAKAEEIIAMMQDKSKKPGAAGGGGDNDGNPMAAIKAEFAKLEEEQGDNEPASKKAKSNMTAMVEAYKVYKSLKNDELKDILGWNNQVKAGNKEFIQYKCIDGHVFGRLALCPLCQGKLKIEDSMAKIVCMGRFDEDAQMLIPCTNQFTQEDAPRLTPWYSSEPTEEQKEEMKKLVEEARGEGENVAASHNDDVEKLKEEAAKIEWKLTGKAGIKKATGELLKILQEHPKQLDLPDDETEARKKLGPIIQANRDKTAEEVVPIIVKDLGFKEDKAAKEEKKEKAAEKMCANPNNAPVVTALKELSELYFKEGNRNAGGTYAKAISGLKDLKYEITAENALTLHKGKTKVTGIGKGTAEKIHEFLATGTIAKLEEKRAANM